MSGELRCDEVRELAPELALGIAGGEERDAALRHLAGCQACRGVVAELASVADELLLLAPASEPPPGFADRVLDRLELPRRRRRWAPSLAIAACIVAALAVGAGVAFRATADDRRVAASYRDVLAGGQGAFFSVATVQGNGDGTVFGYQGSPSWLFATVRDIEPGRYRVSIVTEDGERVSLGMADLGEDGVGTWGAAIPVDLTEVDEVRFEPVDGSSGLTAAFDAEDPWNP